MTDKEMALALGKRLMYAQLVVHEMSLELDSVNRTNPLERRTQQIVNEVKEEILRPAYLERVEALDHKLDESTPAAMLRTLHEFLK